MKKRIKKPSASEVLAKSTEQDYVHQHTVTINSRRCVLEFELSETERAIVAPSKALGDQRRRKREIEARVEGLQAAVARRC